MTDVVTTAKAGDFALGCEHVDPENLGASLHMLKLEDSAGAHGVEIERSASGGDTASMVVVAKWMFLCDGCYRRPSPPIESMRQDFRVPASVDAVSKRSCK